MNDSPDPSQSAHKGILPVLAAYLEASSKQLQSCISECVHPFSLTEPKATVHLQYVKFDPANGEPKFDVLAKVLAKHVVRFSLSLSTREQIKKSIEDPDEGDLFLRARDYFRKIEDAGEVGELLLFFLMEAAFGAPQVVCKMELKTNSGDEVKGADGIHVKWDSNDDHLDVFLGESKLYGDISSALTSIFKSITEFYDLGRLDEELHLVTAHFKHIDKNLQDIITSFINRASPDSSCHVIHACLVGFDWSDYKLLLGDKRQEFFIQFEDHYRRYAPSIEKMLNSRFKSCTHKHVSFKFLFLPFKDVMEFRHAFYRALLGVDVPTLNRSRATKVEEPPTPQDVRKPAGAEKPPGRPSLEAPAPLHEPTKPVPDTKPEERMIPTAPKNSEKTDDSSQP